MQERFAGDVGDFGKYGLLRALAEPPLRLGIIWYLTPDGDSGGNRREYLDSPERFRLCDPFLFDALTAFSCGRENLSRIASSRILPPDTQYVPEPVPRFPSRSRWFQTALDRIEPCDLVFLDPNNGLAPRSVPPSRVHHCHYVYPEEISALQARGKSVLVYHHLSRKEPADRQLLRWLSVLGEDSLGLRFHRYGSRVFFLLSAPHHRHLLIERVDALMDTPWREHFTLHRRPG